MFGIGGTELLVILVVALIVLGPKSVPQIARTLGKAMGEFRKVSTEFQRTLNTEIELEEHEKRKQEAEKELFGTEQKATAATKPAEAASPAAKPAAAATAAAATISLSTPARCRKTASSRTGRPSTCPACAAFSRRTAAGRRSARPSGNTAAICSRAGMYIPSRCSAC